MITAFHSAAAVRRFAGNRLLIGMLFVGLIAVYVIGRLPLYAGYWIPAFGPDSGSYFQGAYQLATGQLPLFGIRTPGYPLFLFATLALTGRVSAVIVLQQLAILLSGLSLYAGFVYARRWLALPAAIAVTGVFCAGDLVLYETYLGTEALYTASLMGAVGALVAALHGRNPAAFAVSSMLMAYAVLVRPAGMFLVVVFAITLALVWGLAYSRKCLAAFAWPFAACLLATSTYNLLTLHQFTISPFGSMNLVAATSTFWADSAEYPAEVRAAIGEMAGFITAQDRQALAQSSDPDELYQLYSKYYNPSLYAVLTKHVWLDPGKPEINRLLKRVAFDAIRAHPKAYVKFVVTNLRKWFDGPGVYWFGYDIDARYREIHVMPQTAPVPAAGPLRDYMLREFNHPTSLGAFAIQRTGERQHVTVSANLALRLQRYMNTIIFPTVFGTTLWLYMVAALALAVAANLIHFPVRALPTSTVTAGIVLLILVGAALVVSLVELGIPRYAVPSRFIWYLSLPLLSWIVVEWCSTHERAGVATVAAIATQSLDQRTDHLMIERRP